MTPCATRSTRACARSKPIFWQGVREAAGIPAAVLAAGYLGFGALAVMLSSARFMPMTMMLMPEMRDPRHRPWKYYVAAQLMPTRSAHIFC